MRTRLMAGGLILVVVTGLSPAQGRSEPGPVYPTLGRTNTIRADGVAGVSLRVPKDVKWLSKNIRLQAGPGTNKVLVAFRNRRPEPGLCDLCFNGTFVEAWPSSPFKRPFVGTCSDDAAREIGCPIPRGVNELYFISDGPVKITMEFPELKGRLDLEATGKVDAGVRRVKSNCLVDDCSIRGGYITKKIGLRNRPAAAGIMAYAFSSSGVVNPTETTVTACAYPGYFNDKSSNPDNYPYGCDVTDPEDGSAVEFVAPGPFLNGGGTGVSSGSGRTHGRQYLGFTIRNRSLLGDSQIDAHAMWVNGGIRCATGNFFDCNR